MRKKGGKIKEKIDDQFFGLLDAVCSGVELVVRVQKLIENGLKGAAVRYQ